MQVLEGRPIRTSRRQFLRFTGAGALCLVLPGCASLPGAKQKSAASAKPLRGIFPIAQTPFTEDNQLDVASLAQQVRFIDRGKVHGFVWPQMASEWTSLSEAERMAGMEAIGAAARGLKPAIVLGVQGADLATVKRYVKKAQQVGADAIISLPPVEAADRAAIMDYYEQVGKSTDLPLFVQAVGDMGVPMLIEMSKAHPDDAVCEG